MIKDKFVLGIILATVVVLIGGIFFVSKMSSSSPSVAGNSSPVSDEQKKLLEVVSDDYIKGNKNASITLVEYLDFECEACRAYYPLVKQLAEEFKTDVRFVNRYFPLPGHKNGMQAALAVEAATKQGKYWEMHDTLYDNQSSWGEKSVADPKIFEGYAAQIGLNLDQFKRDVASKEVKERVERDRNSGNRLGVSGTPTFFLNGEKIPNPKNAEDFKTFIKAAIGKAIKTSPQPSAIDNSTIETKVISLEEVVTHNNETDCWLAIEGKVYDVTEFIPKHPGGKAIIGGCGKDATALFNERPTSNKGPHPAQARELLKGFYIGDLKQK